MLYDAHTLLNYEYNIKCEDFKNIRLIIRYITISELKPMHSCIPFKLVAMTVAIKNFRYFERRWYECLHIQEYDSLLNDNGSQFRERIQR